MVLANARFGATKVIASTTLRNSTTVPSPVRLTSRPLGIAIVGSMRSLPQRPAAARASQFAMGGGATERV